MNSSKQKSSNTDEHQFHIAIIGAGFSGLGLGIKLKQAGIDCFTIYEKAKEVGGTWRDNAYPGAECDVPSHLYSYSFEKNPHWSKMFGTQEEIQDYLLFCTEKYELRPHIQFETDIGDMHFDEPCGIWHIDSNQDEKITANIAVACIGGLSVPKLPEIEGLDSFSGKLMHTARWDKTFSLRDKYVAVIGTGASAIQTIPAIQPEVEHLKVFQRTPAWVMPKRTGLFSEGFKSKLERFPVLRSIFRYSIYWIMEMGVPFLIFNLANSGKLFENIASNNMKSHVSDPELRAKLSPQYSIGCKRMLISGNYYPAMSAQNTEVITRSIRKITQTGITDESGQHHEIDAIICATGFDVPTSNLKQQITGLRGKNLNQAFAEAGGAQAYKGMTYTGFPNFFTIMGPNTGPGHTSVIVYAEGQMNYITQAVKHLLNKDIKSIEVKQSVQVKFNQFVQKRMQKTVWTSGCKSWYLTEDGKNTTLWPGFSAEYRLSVRRFKPSEYHEIPHQNTCQADHSDSNTSLSEAQLNV